MGDRVHAGRLTRLVRLLVEAYELPRASHLLYLENPADLAQALADFYARHPIATT